MSATRCLLVSCTVRRRIVGERARGSSTAAAAWPLSSLVTWPQGRRLERIDGARAQPKWKNPPLRIEMSECINCDACLRHCPSQFGAIFNHGADVVIVPELCSGCDKCLPACPVDCIYPDPEWIAGARRSGGSSRSASSIPYK